ncbi:MAG TPA: hypothetical protein VMM78_20020 [Thermomicrobiales bacterium]|nr:hypothetical protein [Thermomicrobiales bacterium]
MSRAGRYSLGVIGITLACYLAAMPLVLKRLNPITGDEPFYVMTGISLIRDRSLDETANYSRGVYNEFYPDDPLPPEWRGWPGFPRKLPPHAAITARDGLYTKHGLGLSLLIALPYEAIGRVGAMLVVIAMASIAALNMHLLGRESGVPHGLSAAVAISIALTLPFAPYALLLFPEVPAALLMIYAVRRVAAPSNSSWQWALAGCCIGFLPWLHQRFGPSAVALTTIIAYRILRSRQLTAAIASGAPIVAGAASIIAYNLWLYGRPLQNTDDHAGFSSFSGAVNGLFGLLLDAQWGLLIAAPIYVLAFAGLPTWHRQNNRLMSVAVLTVAPYIGVVAAYQVWWGEWGPPARYLVPVIPLAAAPIGCVLLKYRSRGRIAAGLLGLSSVGLMIIALGNPQRLYHHPDGHNNLVGRLSDAVSIDLASALVAFQPLSQDALLARTIAALLMIVVLAIVGLLTYWDLLPRRRR